ncbi:MAG TPA: N,N-dimethylformamidase beta subunit family domain-containing protein [Segeticoccus sp.]|uniref:N,N-dimethylformamidase beta subunit family domain-containing protein n=1 Tax=Segeticoccus sp. TaxID=2706531 RepID=UPI002D7FBD44|nr:N,N-dimethylformamidase beta subunit family domain-containing protein [Segeticoccus sp.]HET8599386.1 N,N-dimethylformamidase beta subunit family domain-containing protein [Segeticoccus sp.]
MSVLRPHWRVVAVAVALLVAAALAGAWWSGRVPPGASAAGSPPRHGAGASASGSPSARHFGVRPPPRPGSAAWTRRENARPGSTAWRIPPGKVAGEHALAGYADHVSVLPGQQFRLFVSCTRGSVTARAFRLGWYHGKGARLVWRSRPFRPGRQAGARLLADRTVVAPWTPSLTVSTKGWPPGTYLLLLRAADGSEKYVPLTVRSTTTAGAVVLVNAVTTYEAYNDWGGYSLYRGTDGRRAYRVSFDRPYDGNGATELLNFEAATIQRAERQGLALAYVTSLDLDRFPRLLAGARGVVSMGHDEYWTVPMRRHVEAARGRGTNVAFLGANADYWRVRFAPGLHGADRMLVGYKADAAVADPVHDAVDTTAMWRQPPHADPENSLTGQLYECFPAHGPMVVRDPGFFLFRGTAARAGSSYAGLVGTEIDRAYPIPGTPRNLQVAAHSPVACDDTGPTFSDLTYYTTASGAGVVDTGTMLWVRALRGPSPVEGIDARTSQFVRRVTTNLFAAMAAGPMGHAHPARGDLAALHASASTRTGTGGYYTLP